MTRALEAAELRAGYGGVDIIHGISLHVDEGEIVTIIGPNGAGKSTFLKAVFGAIPLSGGRVWMHGVEVTGRSSHEMVGAGAGFVPQTENVFPSLTIRENLEMGAYRLPGGTQARIDELLARFPELSRRPGEQASRLSGGQRQSLAMSRALMLRPRLLLLDEPTAALSPAIRGDTYRQILEIRDGGVSILMVEQNAREALAISDRGYLLVGGRNALEQSGAEMLANPDIGRRFLGQVDDDASADGGG